MNHNKLEKHSIPSLNMKEGLQHAGGNPDIYLNFLKNFYEHGKDYRSELQLALMDENNVRLIQRVHGLRGVAATLGAFQLSQACSTLLQKIMDETSDLSLVLLGNIFHALDKLLSDIKNSTILEQQWLAPDKTSISGLLQKFKLILIEDDLVLRKMLADELQKYFGQTIQFGLQREALDYLQQQTSFRDSIIVVDVQLADGSGIEIARAVSQAHPDAYILLISGEEITTSELAGVKNSIQLLKPVEITTLINISKGIALNLLCKKTTKL